MRTETTNIYQYNELSDKAKGKAIEDHRYINIDDEWYDHVIEDAKEIGKLMGMDIDRVLFSGFSSQGDGACFIGDYQYEKGAVKAVMSYAPKDDTLHQIAQSLTDIQKRNFYGLGARTKHFGRYFHEMSADIQVWSNNESMGGANDDAYYEIKEHLRSFMKWTYKQLEKQHEHLTSDEEIKETIEEYEREFYENGDKY